MLKSENESLEKEVAKKESEISMLKMSMKKETDTVGSLEQKLRMVRVTYCTVHACIIVYTVLCSNRTETLK